MGPRLNLAQALRAWSIERPGPVGTDTSLGLLSKCRALTDLGTKPIAGAWRSSPKLGPWAFIFYIISYKFTIIKFYYVFCSLILLISLYPLNTQIQNFN